MMIELKSSEKRKAKILLTEESPTFAHAIAEGLIEGNVYVDDFLTPATALFGQLPGFIMSLETFRTAEEASGFII